MFVQFFESFTKIAGSVEALSTSSFTALLYNIFAKSVYKPGHISLDHFSATQLRLVIYGTLDPARKLAVCILAVELYPNKTKTKTTRQ